ncbi:GIN domain-containing protein [Georgenia yuyongxinii]
MPGADLGGANETHLTSGSGSITFRDIAVEDLTVAVTGSGAVRVEGTAAGQRATITGSGGGDVAVDGTLDARVTGSVSRR